MKHSLLASLPALGAAFAYCCVAGSCTTTPQADTHAGPASSRPSGQAVLRVVQINHGPDARFETCLPPACPSVTPKTLGPGNHAIAPHQSAARTAAATPIATPGDWPAHVNRPEPEPAPRPAQPVPAPSTIRELAVTFAFGSATLTATARASIDEAVTEPGVVRLAIRGRTDSTGPAALNQALAASRARAVEAHLQRAHPRLAELARTVDASGACCYVATNDTAEGRARNRRVEIDIERTTDDP
ncbi:OmpA family protein [Aquabacterium humicola]|uniref:OmpA family protein n=1 Tax=Aquabacterium humicola TaxID=3237377 RepID=UPI002543B72E|nr:OmpA family protein [Rubrivivax pictus]